MTITVDWTTIILSLIGAVVTVLTAYIAKTTGEVHKAVNTNYQTMARELASMTVQIGTLTTLTATQAEALRGAEIARALAQGVAAPAVTPAVQAVEIVPTQTPVPVEVVAPDPPP